MTSNVQKQVNGQTMSTQYSSFLLVLKSVKAVKAVKASQNATISIRIE